MEPQANRVALRLRGAGIRSPPWQGRLPGKRTGSMVGLKTEFLEARMSATVPAGGVGRFAAVKGVAPTRTLGRRDERGGPRRTDAPGGSQCRGWS